MILSLCLPLRFGNPEKASPGKPGLAFFILITINPAWFMVS
jgi:hypothetical protein